MIEQEGQLRTEASSVELSPTAEPHSPDQDAEAKEGPIAAPLESMPIARIDQHAAELFGKLTEPDADTAAIEAELSDTIARREALIELSAMDGEDKVASLLKTKAAEFADLALADKAQSPLGPEIQVLALRLITLNPNTTDIHAMEAAGEFVANHPDPDAATHLRDAGWLPPDAVESQKTAYEAEKSEANTRADTAEGQVAELVGKLGDKDARIGELEALLQAARDENADLQSQLEQAPAYEPDPIPENMKVLGHDIDDEALRESLGTHVEAWAATIPALYTNRRMPLAASLRTTRKLLPAIRERVQKYFQATSSKLDASDWYKAILDEVGVPIEVESPISDDHALELYAAVNTWLTSDTLKTDRLLGVLDRMAQYCLRNDADPEIVSQINAFMQRATGLQFITHDRLSVLETS